MSTADPALAARRRIMFVKGEDFNFLAYNVLVILDALDCHSSEKQFHDHNKLAYLVDLASSPSLATIIARRHRLGSRLSERDLHSLSVAYSNGAARKHFVARVVNALVRRDFLNAKSSTQAQLDVWINVPGVPVGFLTDELYTPERDNIALLKQVSRHLRTINFTTFLTKYFGDQGVRIWHS